MASLLTKVLLTLTYSCIFITHIPRISLRVMLYNCKLPGRQCPGAIQHLFLYSNTVPIERSHGADSFLAAYWSSQVLATVEEDDKPTEL